MGDNEKDIILNNLKSGMVKYAVPQGAFWDSTFVGTLGYLSMTDGFTLNFTLIQGWAHVSTGFTYTFTIETLSHFKIILQEEIRKMDIENTINKRFNYETQ